MRILFVFSGNPANRNEVFNFAVHQPFVCDQSIELQNNGIEIDLFPIVGKGIFGYLKNLPKLKQQIKNKQYDLIHAHYGFSGMLAVLQRKIPVIITFYGSDLHYFFNRCISQAAMLFSAYNLFVSQDLLNKAICKKKSALLNIGVDLNLFFPQPKDECRKKLNLDIEKNYILFGGNAQNKNKNFALALEAVKNCHIPTEIIKLKGYSRQEVAWLMNACDVLLFTSLHEGSPQVIKEAMACNCPIITTNVGDVEMLLTNVSECKILDYDAKSLGKALETILSNKKRSNGQYRLDELTWEFIIKKQILIYNKVISIKK